MNLLKKTDNSGLNIEWDNNTVIMNIGNKESKNQAEVVMQWIPELMVRPDFIQTLEKIEFVSSTHDLCLSWTFVWPGFKVRNSTSSKEEEIEGSFENIINSKSKHCFVVWPELSWKTSIWRMLFLDSLSRGYNPVYLNWENINKNSNYERLIKKEFTEQYDWNLDSFLKQDNKILIIDNFHQRISDSIIWWADNNFDYFIAIVWDEEHMLNFRDNQNYANFDTLSIKHFSSSKQHELIVNWKNWKSGKPEDHIFDKNFDSIEGRISDIITKNHIVPRTPFYILTIIQTFEWYTASDFSITSYWHCYYALLISQLSKKWILPGEIWDCLFYLKNLAYHIFTKWTWSGLISTGEYEKFKINYSNIFLPINKSIISKIESLEYPILRKNEDVKFEFPYTYYYFVWQFLAEKEPNKHIEELCQTIYKKDSAHILIFAIHHTTNHKLLEEIQLHCMTSFDWQPETRLTTEETRFMTQLISELPKSILSEKSIWENRLDERKRMDDFESTNSKTDLEIDDDKNSMNLLEINKSFKIIEVLWQILKNRAGSIEKEKVQELLFEVEKLWLRLLAFLLDAIKSDEVREFIEVRLDLMEQEKGINKNPSLWTKKREFIEKMVQMMAISTIYGILFKVFQSVSIDKLLVLQNQITSENNSPAFELLNILFKISYDTIKIEEIKKLYAKFEQEKNIWALHALSYFLQIYLNNHCVDFKIRQQICSLLWIKYSPNKILIWL